MRRFEEPDCRGAAYIIMTCLFGLLLAVAFGAWAYFHGGPVSASQPQEVVIEVVSEEGFAKAVMIFELTGYEFPPEIAKWAEVKFSGTSVQIETHAINLFDGKKWRELER